MNSNVVVLLILIGLAVLVFLYYGAPYIYGRLLRIVLKNKVCNKKALVLTFDDGPGARLTPLILDILAEQNVKATFFLLGRNVVRHKSLVRRIAAEGHEICSHGYDHLHYWNVPPFRAIADIKRGWQAIDEVLGREQGQYPFRPPYGKLDLFSLLFLLTRKVPICYWTLVSGDTWPKNKRDGKHVARLLTRIGGAIVVAHDFDRVSNCLDSMITDMVKSVLVVAKENGVQVMTMSKLRNH